MAQNYKIVLPLLHSGGQKQIIANRNKYNVLCAGRRWGKNVLGQYVCVTGMAHGEPWGWFAPTYKILAADWRELKGVLAPIIYKKDEQEKRIELVTGGVLECWSLVDEGAGKSRHYAGIVIDEAAMAANLKVAWNEAIFPTLADLDGEAWFLSTPKGKNYFWQVYQMAGDTDDNPRWSRWHHTTYDNPHLKREVIDQMKKSMTEEAYRQEILAMFLEGEGTVFRNIEAVTHAPEGDTPQMHARHILVAGVDWGKQNDFTVISVGCATCGREVFMDRFNRIDYTFQMNRLIGAFEKWKVWRAAVEENAMGRPNIDWLQRKGYQIVPVYMTNPKKADLVDGLSLDFDMGRLQLLPDETAKFELEAFERTKTPSGLDKYAAPEGVHDDTVIARMLMASIMRDIEGSKLTPMAQQYVVPWEVERYQRDIQTISEAIL